MKTTTLGALMPSEYGPKSSGFIGAQELSYLWGGNGSTSSPTIAPFNDYSYHVVESVFTHDIAHHNLRATYTCSVSDNISSEYRSFAMMNNLHVMAVNSDKYNIASCYFNMSTNATVMPYSGTAITTCGIDESGNTCYTQIVFAGTLDGGSETQVYQRKLTANNAPANWDVTYTPEDWGYLKVTYFCAYNEKEQTAYVNLLNKINTYNAVVSVTGASSFKKLTSDSSASDILTALSPKLHTKDNRGTVGTQITSVTDFEKALTYCAVSYNSINEPKAYGMPLYGRSVTGQIQVFNSSLYYKFNGFTTQGKLTSVTYTGSGGYTYSAGVIMDDLVWTTTLSISGSSMSVNMPYSELSIRYNNYKSTLGSFSMLNDIITTESTQDDIISALSMRVNYSSFLDFAPGTWYAIYTGGKWYDYTEAYKLQSVLLALQDAATNGKGFVFADTGSKVNVSKMSMTINSINYQLCWQLSGEEWVLMGSDYKLYKWYLVLAYYNGQLKCVKSFYKWAS